MAKVNANKTLGEILRQQGVSRRGFLKYCAATTSLMALPPSTVAQVAQALENAHRPSVMWLAFQACTGCTEALTRSAAPTLESLIFDAISLDLHDTLQATAGHDVEVIRETMMQEHWGEYLLLVEGSIPTGNAGYSTIGGISNLEMLKETAAGAAAVIAVGTCATFGGIPHAQPNPTGAVSVSDVVKDKPIINISGCPPIPVVLTGVLAQYLTFGAIPELDRLGRPKAFYGHTIHDRCYRRPFYDRGQFAESFDDEGARHGWCLYKVGCKGPITYNACATVKWNQGTSFPIESGHPCLGCSEPNFWDKGGFYQPLSTGQWGDRSGLGIAGLGGAALGVASALAARRKQKLAQEEES